MNRQEILKFAKIQQKHFSEDFVGWVRKYISFAGLPHDFLTDQQIEVANAVIEGKNACVSSGGGTGKSAVAALLIQWFLITHPFAKVPTTAPTGALLNDVLWSEISLWLKRNKLQELYSLKAKRLEIKHFKEWYAVARTVSKDRRELNDTLAGFHAPYLLLAVDEASGVPDPVYTALEGAMTSKNSYILLISNPVSTGGYYYDTINDPEGKGKGYKVLFLDSRESPLVDPSYEERIATRWGRDSPMYRAKVMGQPVADLDTVVVHPERYDEIVSANKLMGTGKIILGVDVAGSGPDPAVFCFRKGDSIYKWSSLKKSDPTLIKDEIIRIFYNLKGESFTVVVENIGEGAGVYSELKKANLFPVIGLEPSKKAIHEAMYDTQRTEGYCYLQKTFNDLHFPVPPPERLKKELANLKFDYSEGPIKMVPKKEFKKDMGFSSDHADPLMLTCIPEYHAAGYQTPHVPKKTGSMTQLLATNKASKYGKFGKFLH